jgi:hypothetical protein
MVVFIRLARTPVGTSNHAKRASTCVAWHSRLHGNIKSKEGSKAGVEDISKEGGFVLHKREGVDTGDKLPIVNCAIVCQPFAIRPLLYSIRGTVLRLR